MSDHIRYKGRFIKKKVLDKKIKIKNALQKKRKGNDLSTNSSEPNLYEGNRVVNLKFLGEKLKCVKCFEVLCLNNIVHEQHLGLNSILKVKCEKCDTLSIVPTSKTHSTAGNKSKHCDINTGVVLGAVHAGYGCSGLNKILACANIPTISPQLFKRYEREVGPAIEKAAKESCKRAAKEERQLVNENIDKLCDLL
ncbi:hypothetical protein PV327_002947 [Microctonus hyperodae]|uniref:Mutator-like transposase domain-containing protein n=1 Tax=Microctonus hyperodae TaxID=165561 RepID=A0AA39L0J5_MICHY|nr:hypothetical protein PV327_002947 [Microctonus hyperodae]